MTVLRTILLMALLLIPALALRAQPSVLHSGDWYKFAVPRNGVYRISFDLLRKTGIDPAKIDPRNIRIYGLEGGMLPQSNAIERPSDLLECAIFVHGESDGRFDRSDYILFYAEGPDDYEYDQARGIYRYENNLYSDLNYYFLTVGTDQGRRINSSENVAGDFHLITSFNAFSHYEKDAINTERSGREWFGEQFGTQTVHTLTYNLPGLTAGSTMQVVSDVMARSHTPASFKLSINETLLAEQNIAAVPNGRYTVKGLHRRDTLSVQVDDIGATGRSTQQVRYEFVPGTGFSAGYLDFILLDFVRNLALYDNQTFFLSSESTGYPTCTFQVSSMTSDSRIWDVSDHHNVREQEFVLTGSTGKFSTSTADLKKWMVFNSKQPEPTFISKVGNRDLSGIVTPNVLIVTHPDFHVEAERLATHRESASGLSTAVVTTEEIFNQFASGRQDLTAMRDFAKRLRDKNPSTLQSILLFGKGSYDYKDRIPGNTNFVPTYQSRNTLHPLQTYSSDDYFGFLEESEGNWGESPAEHHTLDVGIGRLPVTTIEQARSVVDKIIRYDTDTRTLGAWRKKIVFVADDGNTEDGFTSLHQYQSDELAKAIEEDNSAFDARRLFVGSYEKKVQPNGETVPGLVDDLKRTFDLGALIINFTGHGSETVWTDERILTEATIAELRNDRYPFLVTATCEFGRQDDPLRISSAEQSVLHPNGGAVGLVTTARPVNAQMNFTLNRAFYEALFQRVGDHYATIGEIFRKTKNNSTAGVSNRNFSLIGDPSMTLALPDYTAEVTSMKTAHGSDTIKALSSVTVRGRILTPSGTLASDFTGFLEATLNDRQRQFSTIGRNNPPFSYEQWDNAVFRGQASVENGEFEFHFVVPKGVSTSITTGRLGVYAADPVSGYEATGVYTSRIGGVESGVANDITPPVIRLFVGDTTFVNGGIASPDTYLVAKIKDLNGINISGIDPAHSIVAQLDGSEQTFDLNEYFVSDLDSWKSGTIRFPILGLEPGPHQLTLYASDVFNNRAQAAVSFIVTDGSELVIEEFGNYPNPFTENTTLFFTHNRSGDDLWAQLSIFNLAGQLVTSAEYSVAQSGYHIDLLELNVASGASGKKLPPGPYLARVIVRSMSNGSKNEKVTRLIVLN